MASTPPAPWSALLPELLGRVITALPMPNDLARFRAVCRSWHSAARGHGARRLPWIVHSDGSFVVLPRRVLHRPLPLPQGTRFIGASGSWFALDRMDVCGKSCILHNLFFGVTVPLLGLDSVIGDFPDGFKVRKLLMRSSSPDDLVVLVTTDKCDNYQIILCRPGKPGAWATKPHAMPYAHISDVAFLGDNLYGLTSAKGPVHLGLGPGEDSDNKPIVTNFEHIIKYQHSDDDDEVYVNGDDRDDEVSINGDGDDDEVSINEGGSDEPEDPDGTVEAEDMIVKSRYLVESDGKLLMVKRCQLSSPYLGTHNLEVDVMEADMDAGLWVPATAADARAIFISKQSSKSAPAHEKAQTRGFKCYFDNEHDKFTPCDGTHASLQALFNKKSTWVFPPEVVI
ncbi:hypothetical protein BRADI_4g26255v3 [Brachypodium distachyon]|uniref:KIB1-4 beta-propeller domain-containing protein n=1 Tax=Brachypodium distachyon TaxID=15368 RepID=A0A2K2CQB6_BRADI|nr:hypothetical protein BRADI_4g26255v3 [Brachypodium distachyon]